MSPLRGEVWWVSLDPTVGSEIKKARPCLVVTSDVLNRLRATVVVVPYSTAAAAHPPITVAVTCQAKPAVAVIDQVRGIAKHRLKERIEMASPTDVSSVVAALAKVLEIP